MKRFLVGFAAIALLTVTTLGCDKTATTQRKETVTSPNGTTTTTDTHEVKSSGDSAPANSQGEAAK